MQIHENALCSFLTDIGQCRDDQFNLKHTTPYESPFSFSAIAIRREERAALRQAPPANAATPISAGHTIPKMRLPATLSPAQSPPRRFASASIPKPAQIKTPSPASERTSRRIVAFQIVSLRRKRNKNAAMLAEKIIPASIIAKMAHKRSASWLYESV